MVATTANFYERYVALQLLSDRLTGICFYEVIQVLVCGTIVVLICIGANCVIRVDADFRSANLEWMCSVG